MTIVPNIDREMRQGHRGHGAGGKAVGSRTTIHTNKMTW